MNHVSFVGKTYEVKFDPEEYDGIPVWKTKFLNKNIVVKNGDKIKIVDYDVFRHMFLCKLNEEEYDIEVTFEFVENMIDKVLLRLK